MTQIDREALGVAAALLLLFLWSISAGAAEEKDRAKQIAECEAHGGIPVPIAGVVSSRGIGCAQPVGQ